MEVEDEVDESERKTLKPRMAILIHYNTVYRINRLPAGINYSGIRVLPKFILSPQPLAPLSLHYRTQLCRLDHKLLSLV